MLVRRLRRAAAVFGAFALVLGFNAAVAQTALPDWDGLWENVSGPRYTRADGRDNPPPLTPEYQARYDAVLAAAAAGKPINDPTAACLWPGVPRLIVSPFPSEYLLLPKRVTIINENMSQVRRIWTDGRGHPPADEIEPSYNGHSVGHWEGDTLVVHTVGLREDTTFENTGVPHSDLLEVRERIRLVEPDLLVNEVTIIDPKALTRPWTTAIRYRRHFDWSFIDYVCAENLRNTVGKDGVTRIVGLADD